MPSAKRLVVSIIIALVVGGCATSSTKNGSDVAAVSVYHEFRRLRDSGRFHAAFLLLPAVLEDLKDNREDSAGYEWSTLSTVTAERGEKEWIAIFKDPRISLHEKEDLVFEIHDLAVRAIDGNAAGVFQLYRKLVWSGRFHEAFLLMPTLLEELEHVGEGAAGYEYNLLVERTAVEGEDQWAKILKDPSIAIEYKSALVIRIDETAHKAASGDP